CTRDSGNYGSGYDLPDYW
nr:immunoglobulin heavy chain junction region [Macaca mulatta]MOV87703.1 immunoglobulin heavy chain junction region [Macaca mulatta]MOV87816.1 immunoglobulin heavy chain junction region [Macaca mulatta]MOV87824.1 immunoglobulin heavy chain junction region [Macaca mulatta]MOV87874.1 immunoglobulin heavy chain junction region [Macaca mulatta]